MNKADTQDTSGIPQFWIAVFLVMSTLHMILGGLTARGILHAAELPLPVRLSVPALEIVYLALVCGLCAALGMLARRLSWWPRQRSGWRRAGVFVLALGVLVAWLASWVTYRIVGVFIGPLALRMFLNDPVQTVQHAVHLSLPAVAGSAALAVTLAWLCAAPPRRWIRQPAAGWLPALGSAITLAAASVVVLAVPLAQRQDDAALYTRISAARQDGAGPLATWFGAARASLLGTHAVFTVDHPDSVDWKPQISMADYLRRVDTAALQRRNVIVILVESLRSDELLDGTAMPVANQLARRSVVFTNAYSQSSHSNYADLGPLTSQYPLRSADMYLFPEDPPFPRVNLPDLLKQVGYRTAVISSQNENWGGMLNCLDTGGVDYILHAGNYTGPVKAPKLDGGWHGIMGLGKPSGKLDDYYTVSEIIHWIDAQPDQPFFVYTNLQSSHFPYEVPEDFPRRFVTDPQRMPAYLGPSRMEFESVAQIRDLYRDSLWYIDAQLARLFSHLQTSGQLDNTIIVLTADTGTAFNEHGQLGNGASLYDEIVRVPLVVYAPGLQPRVVDELVQHIDVPPGILQLVGLPPHPAFQGHSLFDADRPDGQAAYLVAQTPLASEYAIVQDDWKLIIDARNRQQSLYHLAQDPGERHDLQQEHHPVGQRLAQQLQEWIATQLAYYGDEALQRQYYPPAAPVAASGGIALSAR